MLPSWVWTLLMSSPGQCTRNKVTNDSCKPSHRMLSSWNLVSWYSIALLWVSINFWSALQAAFSAFVPCNFPKTRPDCNEESLVTTIPRITSAMMIVPAGIMPRGFLMACFQSTLSSRPFKIWASNNLVIRTLELKSQHSVEWNHLMTTHKTPHLWISAFAKQFQNEGYWIRLVYDQAECLFMYWFLRLPTTTMLQWKERN